MSGVTQQPVPEGYQQTEIGVYPKEWGISKVAGVSQVVDSLHQTPSFSTDGYAMVRVADIKTGYLNLETTLKVSERVFKDFTRNYKPKKNDIVLSRVGSYGVSSFVSTDEDFCMGQNTVVIKSKIVPEYLYYMLNSDAIWKQIEDGSYGSGYKSLSLNNINELFLPVSSAKEQTAIANALSDVDALITSLEKLIAKKRAIKTAAMQQLLTGKKRLPPFCTGMCLSGDAMDGKEPIGTGTCLSGDAMDGEEPIGTGTCLSGDAMDGEEPIDQAHTGYKQTELGEIPEDWEVHQFGTCIKSFQLGGNYKNNDVDSGVPLIKMGNIARGHISLKKIEYVPKGQAVSEKDHCRYDDIFFNTRNTLELVGKVSIWSDELPKAYFNSNLMRIAFKEEYITSNRYMNYLMNSKYFVDALADIAIGTTSVAAIYTRDLIGLKIILPNPDEQIAIADVLSSMDEEIKKLEQRLTKTQQLKQGMMQELLTGKTRLL